jgi:GNAT superfamily N-acetyltransferase
LRFTPEYSAIHRLADGTKVRLRLLRPEDRDWLLAGFAHLSPESRYRRFFTAMPRLPESTLKRLLNVDGQNHLAIAAEDGTRPTGEAESLGVARFVRLKNASDTAEAAVAVVDHMQGRGLGKLLLATLAAAARERGIVRFRAEVLRTNEAMKALLHDVDETARPKTDGTLAVYELDLPEPSRAEEATGPLFGLLRLAAGGLEFLLRYLDRTPRSSPRPAATGRRTRRAGDAVRPRDPGAT